ncbi:hypothetical protein SAMN05216359_101185 [Roseateles sp. YR242]|nr:hypothetical protein SAMN05216359_101185 [Roseateles sp. YR242]
MAPLPGLISCSDWRGGREAVELRVAPASDERRALRPRSDDSRRGEPLPSFGEVGDDGVRDVPGSDGERSGTISTLLGSDGAMGGVMGLDEGKEGGGVVIVMERSCNECRPTLCGVHDRSVTQRAQWRTRRRALRKSAQAFAPASRGST